MASRQIYNQQAGVWRQRIMRKYGMDLSMPVSGALTIPNWLTGKTMVFFFVALFACLGALGYAPTFELLLTACISVVLFFYGGMSMSKSWGHTKERQFVRNVFVVGLIIRLIWMLYCYYSFNPANYGNTYGDNTDTLWYIPFGKDLAEWIGGNSKYTLSQLIALNYSAIDDVGYPMWLGLLYRIFGLENDALVPYIFKCAMSAYCAISIYNISKRHYGEGVARMAAIFVCVNPNMIFWCGNMMKEAEMVFLTCLAIDNFDRVSTSGQRFTFKNLLPGMLATTALMFFRVALGLVIILAFFAHIVMATNRVMSVGKKVLAGVLVSSILMLAMGDRLRMQSQELMESARSNNQKANMEWRSTRSGGNSFAKYASTAVFAPLIFTIPFPTFNQANEGQLMQVQLSGGYYIKNVLSFFVILVMFLMLISGEWRRHVFIIAYTVGYHVVLVMSPFAQSGRFHMPVIPLLMLFGAYGVQIAKNNARVRKWLPMVLVAEVAICLAWNWFKLKGRGMI